MGRATSEFLDWIEPRPPPKLAGRPTLYRTKENVIKRIASVLLAAGFAVVAVQGTNAQQPSSPTESDSTAQDRLVLAGAPAKSTKHYITNLDGSRAPTKLGYDVFDVNASARAIRSLPKGVLGLAYVGQKCPTPADAAFKRTVRKFADSRKLYGYYLSDEPHIADCPRGPAALASRADFIRKVTDGRQKSFIVLSKDEDYRSFRPARTHVDLVGLNPYPCSKANPTCEYAQIGEEVRLATRAGIPLRKIVPVYQAFGQANVSDGYYNLPTAKQMRRMLAEWDRWVPNPQLDYTYSWGNQGSSSNPTLIDSPALQRVFQAHFAR